MNKKGMSALDGLGKLAIGVLSVTVVLVVGFLILAQGQAQLVTLQNVDTANASTYTAGYNATVTLQSAMNDIPGWVPIVIIVSIGAILIGLVAIFRRMSN